MFECPHCGQTTITAWAKFNAAPGAPAICSHCQHLSYPHDLRLLAAGLLSAVLPVAVTASLFALSWWPVVICLLVYVLIEAGIVRWLPLVAVTEVDVRRVRVEFFLLVGLFVAFLVYSFMHDSIGL